MYRIEIEDNIHRDHVDPEYGTYEDARNTYIRMLTFCMENGISVHISLWKVIDGESIAHPMAAAWVDAVTEELENQC